MSVMRSASIGVRLAALAGAGALISMGIGVASYQASTRQAEVAALSQRLVEAESLGNSLDSSVNLVGRIVSSNIAFPEQTNDLAELNEKYITAGDKKIEQLKAMGIEGRYGQSVGEIQRLWKDFTDGARAAHKDLKPGDTPEHRAAVAYSFHSAGWKIEPRLATFRAALSKAAALAAADGQKSRNASSMVIVLAPIIGAALLVLLAWRIGRSIVHPVREMVVALSRIASGDYRAVSSTQGRDEVSAMERALEAAVADIRAAMNTVRSNAHHIDEASTMLLAVSRDVDAFSCEASAKVEMVNATSEQLLDGVRTASRGADQMLSAIQEISQNSARASNVAEKAVEDSHETTESVNALVESTNRIADVVDLIMSIADQTNLLALNATIEAARAGESGRGFAIVATEVKQLAQNTSEATENIAQLIKTIEVDSQRAVEAIRKTSTVVAEISDCQAAIAGAVEEQTVTTNEMASTFASAGEGSRAIADSMQAVARVTADTTAGAASTRVAAEGLADLAGDLKQVVSRFKLD